MHRRALTILIRRLMKQYRKREDAIIALLYLPCLKIQEWSLDTFSNNALFCSREIDEETCGDKESIILVKYNKVKYNEELYNLDPF